MSGVYESDRSPSAQDHMALARQIRIEVTSLMSSDNVVPKRKRFLVAVPTVETARNLTYHMEAAEGFYPSTAHGVIWRKHYLTLAIADCHQLVQDLQLLPDMGMPVNVNRFENIANLLEKEIDTLKTRRHNTKLTGKKSPSEKIAKLQAELAELYELESDKSAEERHAGLVTA